MIIITDKLADFANEVTQPKNEVDAMAAKAEIKTKKPAGRKVTEERDAAAQEILATLKSKNMTQKESRATLSRAYHIVTKEIRRNA